jgi:hypothetical protein
MAELENHKPQAKCTGNQREKLNNCFHVEMNLYWLVFLDVLNIKVVSI